MRFLNINGAKILFFKSFLPIPAFLKTICKFFGTFLVSNTPSTGSNLTELVCSTFIGLLILTTFSFFFMYLLYLLLAQLNIPLPSILFLVYIFFFFFNNI